MEKKLPTLDIAKINQLMEKPAPFAPGDAQFWTDPYIGQWLLQAHLNPNNDMASRRPETIQRVVDWLTDTLALQPGSAVLDLGCGPGLYAERLARKGLLVTGVDFSQNSIDYAIRRAVEEKLEIEYRCMDYLQLREETGYEAQFDAALLIYGDLCPLSPEQRQTVFAGVWRALKPGGLFVLDVTTPALHQREGLKNQWYAEENGFWRKEAHIVLERSFAYEDNLFLDQYVIIEEGGVCVYHNWFQDYTPDSIRAELAQNGFAVQGLWSDLTGTPYAEPSDWIGVAACKA